MMVADIFGIRRVLPRFASRDHVSTVARLGGESPRMIGDSRQRHLLVTDLISVIVTTYEREDALAAVLRSLARQSDRNFEVVVADDGSGPRTAALIEQWKPRLGVPLSHAWHEHDGFRAGQIRNRAMLACRGGYFVFLDGDCLARPDFVAVHRALAEPGWFVSGNRALLSRALTETVLRDNLEPEFWGYHRWLGQRVSGGVNRVAPMLRLPLGPFRKLRAGVWRAARSCNFGAWRSDLVRIGGFDADFSGWGREDSVLCCAWCAAACAARTANSPPACCTCGIPRPRSHAWRKTTACSAKPSPANGCRPSRPRWRRTGPKQ
jgi:hypothetical protein